MSTFIRAAREGFMDSIHLAGALIFAIADGVRTIAKVLVAFVHHETLKLGDNDRAG